MIHKAILRKLNFIEEYDTHKKNRKVSSSCSTSDTCHVADKRHENHLTWKSCCTLVYVNKYKQHK